MIPNTPNEAELLQRIEFLEKIITRGHTFDDNYGKTTVPEKPNDQ